MTQATPNADSGFSRYPPRPLPTVYMAETLLANIPPMVPFVRVERRDRSGSTYCDWLPTGPVMAKWDRGRLWNYDSCKIEPIGDHASDGHLARIDGSTFTSPPTNAEFWNALPIGAIFEHHACGKYKKIDIDRYEPLDGYERGIARTFWHRDEFSGFFTTDQLDKPNTTLALTGEPPMPATPPPRTAGEFWDSIPIGARFAFADGPANAPAPYTKISLTRVKDCHGYEFPFFMDPGVGCRHFYEDRSSLLCRSLRVLGETEPAAARPFTSRCCYSNFPNEAASRPPDTCLRRHAHCAKCCACNRCHKCKAEFKKDAKPCPSMCGYCVACCTCPEKYGRRQASFHKRSLKFHSGQPCALAPSTRMAAAELEYIGCHDNKPIDTVCSLWGHSVCADGSLPSDTGFEINTQPASGDKLVLMIEDICAALGEGNASVDGRCGIHIHVDVRDFGPQEIQRLALLYAVVEDGIFMLQPSSRKQSVYCIPCGDKLTTGLREQLPDEQIVALLDRAIYENSPYVSDCKRTSKPHGRYKAMNLHSWNFRKTVEFRHSAGSRDFEKILFWMTLLVNLCDQAKSMDLGAAIAIHEKKLNSWKHLLSLSPTDECTSWMEKRCKELKKSGGVDVPLSDNPYHY